ncbi:MAG: hypothetical protein K8T20_09925 [Planctomycetes bacterium]|nr:hypothetical protein [Planctomycetota bacterium]
MKKTSISLAFAAALGALFGCGQAKRAPPPPIRTTRVEDPVAGFRIDVPEGWVRFTPTLQDPRRRWFAAQWVPAGTPGSVEGIFVHLMTPGCKAADLGGKFAGAPFATELNPEAFSILNSSAGSVGTRQAFRLDGKYHSQKLGDIFEATAYVETTPGSGVLITSRGTLPAETTVRARLEAALGGFEPIKREVRLQATTPHSGGVAFALPEGFDEYFGPGGFGTIAYAVGPSDVQGHQESVSLSIAPPVPSGEQFLASLLAEATKGLTRSQPRKMKLAGKDVQGFTLSPPEGSPRYEVAVTMFRVGDQSAALCVHAAMMPPGRALDLLESIAGSVAMTTVPMPKLEEKRFGEMRLRMSAAPEGWEVNTDDVVMLAKYAEKVALPGGGEPQSRPAVAIEATLDEDYRGNGTPRDAARDHAAGLPPKKSRAIAIDDFALPDGRQACRLTVATQNSYDFFFFARSTSGSLAQVHVLSLPGLSALGEKLGEQVLAATRYLPFADQKAPPDAVLEASRKALPDLLARSRGRKPAALWYVEEVRGKEAGGQLIRLAEDGTWVSRERRPMPGGMLESSIEGAPGTTHETVTVRATKAPGDPASTAALESVTTINAAPGAFVQVLRKHSGGDEQSDRIPTPDPWLPPDVSASDGLLVALATEPEGTYAFASVSERTLFLRWKEYRVLGEEDVEVPAGKFKARRIEFGAQTIYWVANGTVVRAEMGDFVRKLSTEDLVSRHFKD